MTTARIGDLRVHDRFRTLHTRRFGLVLRRKPGVSGAECMLAAAPGMREEDKLLHEAVLVEVVDWRAA